MSKETKMAATREGYGEAITELGEIYPELVVLDADLANATKTSMFRDKFPDRHIDCGIAEANMTGIAAGLAACGKIPFISSFAMFVTGRNYEQIRNTIGYPHLNVKIGASHAGITVGEDGASHQCTEDIALMRTIPGMTVVCPADAIETKAAVRAAIEMDGPIYMRMSRAATPVVNDRPDYSFELGKGVTLKDGNDITIVATGIEVYYSLVAAKMLEKDGISARLINIHTIKPLDQDIILKAAKETKKIFTVEEGLVTGGLGSAVADLTASKHPAEIHMLGIQDVFGESGPWQELLHKYELDGEGIYKQIKEMI